MCIMWASAVQAAVKVPDLPEVQEAGRRSALIVLVAQMRCRLRGIRHDEAKTERTTVAAAADATPDPFATHAVQASHLLRRLEGTHICALVPCFGTMIVSHLTEARCISQPKMH